MSSNLLDQSLPPRRGARGATPEATLWRIEYGLREFGFALTGDDSEMEDVARSVYSGAQGRSWTITWAS